MSMNGDSSGEHGPARPNPAARPPRGLARRALDILSSVWFGVTILSILFVYMSVGSAGYVIRQMPVFEMTEYEWFNWWPFTALCALLCLSLVLVTLRRIRLNWATAGVWMVHAGIVTLSLGSVWYFAAKVEGDTPVFRRRIVIERPGHAPVSLIALPGARASVGEGADRRDFEVLETRPDQPLPADAGGASRAYAVAVAVRTPSGERFTQTLLDGASTREEDADTLGARLRLEPVEQDSFFLVNSWALFFREIRPDGAHGPWVERPIKGLPRYNDYISSRADLWPPLDGAAQRIRPIDIPLEPAPAPPDAALAPVFDALDARVTSYLRYAVVQSRYVRGAESDPLNPVVVARIGPAAAQGASRSAGQEVTLAAFEPARSQSEDGSIAFQWAPRETDIDEMVRPREGEIVVTVAGGEPTRFPAKAPVPGAPEPEFVAIGASDGAYAVRVREVVPNLTMPDGASLSLAIVDVRGPAGEFTRWVAEDPRFTRDFTEGADGSHDLRPPDQSISITFSPPHTPAPVTLIASRKDDGSLGLWAAVAVPGVEARRFEVKPDEPTPLGPMASLTVASFWPNATVESRPVIVPRGQRDKDAGTNYALIRLEIASGGSAESRWLPFHQYVFDDANYIYGGRFRFEPATFTLADGRVIEALFSRERRALPRPVRLDDFRLVSHVGGFTGEVASIRDWESVVRFRAPDGWSDARVVRTNGPVQHEGFRFFQAMWDPPQNEIGSGGLNFTGLGIGNRRGVGVQLAGSILATVGMLWAFYVKPVVRRRRAADALARAEATARARTPERQVRTGAHAVQAPIVSIVPHDAGVAKEAGR